MQALRSTWQVLTSLFGSLPWHRKKLTWDEIPMLRCLRADLLALGSFTADTLTGIPSPQTLQDISRLGDADIDACLVFKSTCERSSKVRFGPRNAPVHRCDRCEQAFDTTQRLELHRYSRHGIRNRWRASVSEPVCHGCRAHFASLETARRHITADVCGLAHSTAPPPAPAPVYNRHGRRQRRVEQAAPRRTILDYLRQQGGHQG